MTPRPLGAALLAALIVTLCIMDVPVRMENYPLFRGASTTIATPKRVSPSDVEKRVIPAEVADARTEDHLSKSRPK